MPRPKRSAADLVRAATDLNSKTERNVGYSACMLALASLPFRNPGDDKPAFVREIDEFSLSVQQGVVDGKPVGYPFGVIPRLVLTWMCTEALRTGSPDLELGGNLSEFMRQIGLLKPGSRASGGTAGAIGRLERQMERLFRARITIDAEGGVPLRRINARIDVAAGFELFWPRDGQAEKGQRTIRPARVILSPEFYAELNRSRVPVDMDALRALSGSALRLDLYLLLVFWMSVIDEPLLLTWNRMWLQFGNPQSDNSARRAQLKTDVKRQLPQVLEVYREAQVEVTKEGLWLYPSPPHVQAAPSLPELEPGLMRLPLLQAALPR